MWLVGKRANRGLVGGAEGDVWDVTEEKTRSFGPGLLLSGAKDYWSLAPLRTNSLT